MKRHVFLLLFLLIPSLGLAAQPGNLEEQVHSLASQLRCVVCQNLSVADSPSEMAKQMREIVREQLQQGKSPEEIKAYFVSKYGEWVLLAPPKKGFSLFLWVLPFVAVVGGVLLVILVIRRWVKTETESQPQAVDPALVARVHNEIAAADSFEINPEDVSPQAPLLQEQARLYADLKELEFDFHAGKLSDSDYLDLRQDLEQRAASVLKQIESQPSQPQLRREAQSAAPKTRSGASRPDEATQAKKASFRTWQIVTGGAFLLIFGLAIGVFLTRSIRPRGGEGDSITGGFMTGTESSRMSSNLSLSPKNTPSLVAQGRAAFERQEWPKAIEAFKAVLAADPNQPEAHTYMGLILVQAGHADGALLAFDKALATNPNFSLALWGKGMVLYRDKQDYGAAREIFTRLVGLLPAGEEKQSIEKTLAEMPKEQAGKKKETKQPQAVARAKDRIEGTISVDPKLKTKLDGTGSLFIIARAGDSSGGPPLAVKKIDRPTFPLTYSIGPENVMVQGMAFAGKLSISVRFDKDGNPMTQGAGTLTGNYKKNPVEVGSKKIDIVISGAK